MVGAVMMRELLRFAEPHMMPVVAMRYSIFAQRMTMGLVMAPMMMPVMMFIGVRMVAGLTPMGRSMMIGGQRLIDPRLNLRWG